jgi:hypothetical protein
VGKEYLFIIALERRDRHAEPSTFPGLEADSGEWAITDALTGIHCAGLEKEGFRDIERERRVHGVVATEQLSALRGYR